MDTKYIDANLIELNHNVQRVIEGYAVELAVDNGLRRYLISDIIKDDFKFSSNQTIKGHLVSCHELVEKGNSEMHDTEFVFRVK